MGRPFRLLASVACALLLGACGGGEPVDEPATAPIAAVPPRPAAAAAVAPASVPAASAASSGPGSVAARALLDGYLQAWNGGDAATIAAFLAEDAQVFDALLARKYSGRAEAQREVINMYLRAVPDGQWSLRGEPVVSADGFSYEWTLAGTNSGNWTHYLRGRGQRIDFKGVSIVRLRDGRIAYQANYFDTNALGAQAGW
jgi:steroid delta-isomerase-like uncharacterized protein